MTLVQVPIPLRSVVMPTPPSVADFLAGTANWQPTSVTTTDWGTLQVLIDSVDVTQFRGVPCTIESWGSQEPFGDDQAVVNFPQILQFDTLGPSGTVTWCYAGAPAQINLVRPDLSTKVLFAGYVQILGEGYSAQSGTGTSTTNGSTSYLTLTLQGTMYQLGLAELTPYFTLNTQDAGTLIVGAVNSVIGKRYATLTVPNTTVAAGSNGVDVTTFTGTQTLHVASTTGFPTAGYVVVAASAGNVTIVYTGTSGGNSFTGCTVATGGTGTLATGDSASEGTGFPIAADGSFTTVLEYVQDVLGQCVKLDGTTQWTLACDNSTTPPTPSLTLKDVATVDWTVDAGAPGVDTSGLSDDVTLNTNVLYGSGTTPQGVTTPFNLDLFGIATGFDPGGQTIKNSAYPGLEWTGGSGSTPLQAFPVPSPGDTISVGGPYSTDAATTPTGGISLLQGRIGTPVTGTYNSTDFAAVEAIQTADGLTVDGIVGAQTWVAIWASAAGGGQAVVLPLWELGQTFSVFPSSGSGIYQSPVDPYLRNAQGATVNAAGEFTSSQENLTTSSPAGNYNPDILRVESYIGMGAGITLLEAKNRAQAIVNRDFAGSWAGTIILTTDPHEGSRFEMRAGDNIAVNYFHGTSLLFHISQVEVAFDTAPSVSTGIPSPSPTLSVTLTVDTAARDATTGKAYVSHTPGSVGDPVRRPDVLKRKSRLTNDTVLQVDAAAGAGVVPIHPIRAGLWTVLQIPFAQVGQISAVTYQSSSSASPFYLAVFNQKVTPADMISILGSAGDPTQSQIWQTTAVSLHSAGLVVAWGGDAGTGLQPCGYWPLTLGQGGSLTGKFRDDGNWNYHSTNPPWLWVAEYSPDSCNIAGVFEQLGSVGASPA